MMKIYLRTKQGEVVGRVPHTNLNAFEVELENDFIGIEDPVNANIIQTHISNDKGEIQLIDGSWVAPQIATQVGPEGIMLKNILRMVSLKTPVIKIRTSEIAQFRELSDDESDEYSKGIQSAKLTSSKLATNVSSIQLPDDLING